MKILPEVEDDAVNAYMWYEENPWDLEKNS